MNRRHCDICDQVIDVDFYKLTRYNKNRGFDFGYREICLDCIKKILSDEEMERDEI